MEIISLTHSKPKDFGGFFIKSKAFNSLIILINFPVAAISLHHHNLNLSFDIMIKTIFTGQIS